MDAAQDSIDFAAIGNPDVLQSQQKVVATTNKKKKQQIIDSENSLAFDAEDEQVPNNKQQISTPISSSPPLLLHHQVSPNSKKRKLRSNAAMPAPKRQKTSPKTTRRRTVKSKLQMEDENTPNYSTEEDMIEREKQVRVTRGRRRRSSANSAKKFHADGNCSEDDDVQYNHDSMSDFIVPDDYNPSEHSTEQMDASDDVQTEEEQGSDSEPLPASSQPSSIQFDDEDGKTPSTVSTSEVKSTASTSRESVAKESPKRQPRPVPQMPAHFTTFSPKHSFGIYLQYVASCLLSPDFEDDIRATPDDYFSPAIHYIESSLDQRKNSLITSTAWKKHVQVILESRPVFSGKIVTSALDCEICGRTNHTARFRINLSGAPYDSKALWKQGSCQIAPLNPDDSQDAEPCRFFAGQVCYHRCAMFHIFHHYKYNFINTVQIKLQAMGADDIANDEQIKKLLNQIIDDKKWVNNLYEGYKKLIEQAQAYCTREGSHDDETPYDTMYANTFGGTLSSDEVVPDESDEVVILDEAPKATKPLKKQPTDRKRAIPLKAIEKSKEEDTSSDAIVLDKEDEENDKQPKTSDTSKPLMVFPMQLDDDEILDSSKPTEWRKKATLFEEPQSQDSDGYKSKSMRKKKR